MKGGFCPIIRSAWGVKSGWRLRFIKKVGGDLVSSFAAADSYAVASFGCGSGMVVRVLGLANSRFLPVLQSSLF